MRYIRHNFVENFSNFDGDDKSQILIDELAKSIVLYPSEIAEILRENGIKVRSEKTNNLIDLIRQNVTNKDLIRDISALVLSVNRDRSFDGNDNFIGKKGDGKWREKIGDFYDKNKDKIAGAADAISDILGSRSGVNQVQGASETYSQINVPQVLPRQGGNGSNQTLIIAAVAIAAVGLIGVVLWTRRNN